MINRFEDLVAWQKARNLVVAISLITKKSPFKNNFYLVDQIIRSSMSIAANIAEGYGRYTYRDYKHFLTMARGSLTETQNHLYIALDLKYLSDEEFETIYKITTEVYKLINGLISYLKKSQSTKKQPI